MILIELRMSYKSTTPFYKLSLKSLLWGYSHALEADMEVQSLIKICTYMGAPMFGEKIRVFML